jgi:glyoxylase-like metal-dependent hydrolase (beta-lactamase superfamily II)
MKIHRIALGMHQANCYIIKNKEDILILDPGARPERIKTYLGDGAKVTAILLTHGHFDHFGAVDELVKTYGCPVYLHEADEELLDNEMNGMSGKMITVKSPLTYLQEGILKLGTTILHIWEAPGHTKGSVLIETEGHLFCGDVLFQGSIGRTDLHGGSEREMKRSLARIKTFDPKLIVHPGHGEETTIGIELKNNPFLLQ